MDIFAAVWAPAKFSSRDRAELSILAAFAVLVLGWARTGPGALEGVLLLRTANRKGIAITPEQQSLQYKIRSIYLFMENVLRGERRRRAEMAVLRR